MAAQHFRSAFNGFNRQDVVRYIEYLNNMHNAQIEQLNNQLHNALKYESQDVSLQNQLDSALEKCARLEAQLAAASTPTYATEQELEAYRRAERTERLAQERAQEICTKANAVLADATTKAEAVASQITSLTQQASEHLMACQEAISGTQSLFQDAVSALYAIKPENET